MDKVYQTVKSKGILIFYWAILVFILFMLAGVPTMTRKQMSGSEPLFYYVVFLIIFIWFCLILYRIYHTNYHIINGRLIINGAFNKNTIHINNIESIEKTNIPFGIRLFGGSFIGGRYYLPGIGKAWVAMTNFKDGVHIRTRDKENYIITPENPQLFVKDIKKLISH